MNKFTDPLFIDKWERDSMTDNKTQKNHIDETFIDYFLIRNKNKLIIKGKLIYNTYEKIGIYVLYLIPPLIIYYLPLRGSFFIVVKLVLMVLAFIISKKIVNKLFAVTILEINKEQKELRSNLDEFKVALSAIQELSIAENVYQKQNKEFMKYRLKFVLPDGEKSSIFAFTSYNKVQEIADIIKNS